MSLHLMDCVKPIQLRPSLKLALMAFADSAGDGDSERVGYPGLKGVMQWSCVKRSQAQDLVNELVDRGLLEGRSKGHKGRNARYVVFPSGCCELPGHGSRTLDPPSLADVAAALGVDLSPEQLAAIEALASPDAQGPADRHQKISTGTGTPASSHGTDTGRPDPMTDEGSSTPAPITDQPPVVAEPSASGTGKGPVHRHRVLGLQDTSPPTPHASGAGGACPTHDTPAANCRGCGTTPRQQLAAQRRQDALDAAPARDRCPGGHIWAADGSCGCPPPVQHQPRTAERKAS